MTKTPGSDAERAMDARPLANLSDDTLRLELHLRGGPAYQCQSPDCRAFHDGPGKWDTCPSCKRKGFLCGSFVLDKTDVYYKDWERRTFAKYPQAARSMPVQGVDAERLESMVNKLIADSRKLQWMANRLKSGDALTEGEVREIAYSVEKQAREIFDTKDVE